MRIKRAMNTIGATTQFMSRRAIPLLAATALAAAVSRAADNPAFAAPPFKHYIGYHGPDGTQVYPNCKPPVVWDGAGGLGSLPPELASALNKNVLWQTLLPFFGNGGPIVVNGRVLLMCEPGYKSDFPELVCLEADSGKILWQRQINHLDIAVPDPEKRAEVAGEWHDYLAWRAFDGALGIQKKRMAKGWGAKKMEKEHEAKRKEYAANRGKPFPEFELELETNREGGANRPGTTFPTPCSDGRSVFVATGWRQYACYDLDGNLVWLKWIPRRHEGDYHGAGGWRSPILWTEPAGNGAGLFIADTHDFVRAFDKKTGAIRWEVSRVALGIVTAKHLSPKLFRVGETDLIWCGGPLAIRPSDGKALKIEGWANGGTMAAVNTDSPDTLFLAGGGHHGEWRNKGVGESPAPSALRFSLSGDALKANVLWSGIEGRASACESSALAYARGKLFFANWRSYLDCHGARVILDAASGRTLKGVVSGEDRTAVNAIPPTCHIYAIADGRIYGIGAGGPFGCPIRMDDEPAVCAMEVYDLDGNLLAVNKIQGPRIEDELKAMNGAGLFQNRFSYAMPFTIGGDRIYVRGNFMLHCIGERKP